MKSGLRLCHGLALAAGLGLSGVASAVSGPSAPCAAAGNATAITTCFLDLTKSGSGDVTSALPRVHAPSADGSTIRVGDSEFRLNVAVLGNGAPARLPRAPLSTHSGGVADELQALLPGNLRCAQAPCKVRAPLSVRSVGTIDGTGDSGSTGSTGQPGTTRLPTPPSALLLALGLAGLVTMRATTGARRASRV